MAEYIEGRETVTNPVNPSVFGEDLETVAWQALGLGVTAFGNDKLVAPIVKGVAPSTSGAMAKLLDAVTTGVTAWLLGEGVGMVNRVAGRQMKHGGLILAAGKGISVLIPSFSISATIPNFLPAPAKALPPASNGNGSVTMTRLGVGSMGLS